MKLSEKQLDALKNFFENHVLVGTKENMRWHGEIYLTIAVGDDTYFTTLDIQDKTVILKSVNIFIDYDEQFDYLPVFNCPSLTAPFLELSPLDIIPTWLNKKEVLALKSNFPPL